MNAAQLDAWITETIGHPVSMWKIPVGALDGMVWAAVHSNLDGIVLEWESLEYAKAFWSLPVGERTGRGATYEEAILDLVERLTGRTP